MHLELKRLKNSIAVAQTSKSDDDDNSPTLPARESAIQQVWGRALRPFRKGIDVFSAVKNLFPEPAAHSLCSILIGLNVCCAHQNIFAADGHWVTTWGCGPQLTETGNLPPATLANSTLRQFVHVSIGGNHLRARFSNAYGTNSVTINSAHVALSAGAGSAGNGDINTATDEALTFHGAPSVNIPPGEVVLSDPFDYNLPALTNLAVSIFFGNISATTINGHPGSRTASFIVASNVVSAASLPTASKTAH